MYLTYEQYKEMGGEITEAAFCRSVRKACSRLDHLTFNRLASEKTIPDAVLYLLFDLIPLILLLEDTETGKQTTSFSNDGVSQSFTIVSSTEISEKIDNRIYEVCGMLCATDGTPLLYRGCD